MQSRRQFMFKIVPAIAVGGLVAREALAQAKVAESDPQAVGLGYKEDATKVDKAKFAKYAAGQTCANCALYQGQAEGRVWQLRHFSGQAGCRQRLVQRLGEEGLSAASLA